MPTRHEVCTVEELQPGERTILDIDQLPHSIGVFNVDGEFHAVANVCPHQFAPLCEGPITGSMESDGVGDYRLERDGEIVECPWHGWKFDITDGSSVFNPHELRARTYDVEVEERDRPEPDASDGTDDGDQSETELLGEEPPIDTYPVEVDGGLVVVHV